MCGTPAFSEMERAAVATICGNGPITRDTLSWLSSCVTPATDALMSDLSSRLMDSIWPPLMPPFSLT